MQAGDLSGEVVDIGIHSTEILNRDKFPTIVPNSFFSSQVTLDAIKHLPMLLRCLILLKFFRSAQDEVDSNVF